MTFSKTLARDIMNAEPPFCHEDTPISELAGRFADEGIGGLLVVDEDRRLIGVITESDLIDQRRNLHMPTAIALFDMVIPMGEARFEEELSRLQAMTAADLACTDVKTISPETDLSEIATMMSDFGIHHLPVLENELVVGLINKHDVIKALVHAG